MKAILTNFREELIVVQLFEKFTDFVESEDKLKCSQEPILIWLNTVYSLLT
jgi:hypothetical protein